MRSPFRSLPFPNASGQLTGVGAPGGQYAGLCLHSAGTACVVRLWDNTAASGTLLDVLELTASGVGSFASYVLDDKGGEITKGIYVEIVSGSPEGAIRIY